MKIILNVFIVLSSIVIVVNALNIDLGELTNWEINHSPVLNMVVSILALFSFIIAKHKRQSITDTTKG